MFQDGTNALQLVADLAPYLQHRHILVVTGNVDQARVDQITNAGLALMRKPVKLDEVIDWISRRA